MKTGAKRFYDIVDVLHDGAAFAIRLDGKTVKTPSGQPLLAPTLALADAIAEEWRQQGAEIDLNTLALTKALNTSLDRVSARRDEVVIDLAGFAQTDLLCYRAEAPSELVRRQHASWDPWLNWAAGRYGGELRTVTGVSHIQQPTEALSRIRDAVAAHTNFELTALHTAISISGSAILGLAFTAGALSADECFNLSRIDEDFQAERWGRDAEAETVRLRRLEDLMVARRYLDLLAA